MLVTIVRGGGLAGLLRRTELDSAELPPDAVAELTLLVGNLPSESPSAASLPDELRYELIVDEGGATTTLRPTEQTLSEDERLLIAVVDGRPESVESVEPV